MLTAVRSKPNPIEEALAMLRRSLCALAALTGLIAPGTVDAHPPFGPGSGIVGYAAYRPIAPCRAVRVYYRTCRVEPWRVYGAYHSEWRAYSAARHLRGQGYEVIVHGW
jgi:hypothetical protein